MPPRQTPPPASPEDEVDSLHQRGMQIPNRKVAAHFIRNTGIGFLREYLPPLDKNGCFRADAGFDDIMNLYHFDRNLRPLELVL